MKIYGFWILLFSTATKINSFPPNLYLLKDGSYTHCLIANEIESSAVMLTTTNQLPVKGHHYPNDTPFCKISTDSVCGRKLNNDVLKYDVSVNYDLSPIDDRRWEDLNFVKTRIRRFINVYEIQENNSDFNFTLSVKIKQDAQIFLCEEMDPLNSSCYWFIIGGWRGKKGVVRKCKKGCLPRRERGYPDNKTACGNPPNVNYNTPPLNLNEWSDFIFTKINNSYNVTKGSENILNYTDINGESFKTKYVFVGSIQEYPGQWKINNNPTVYYTLPYNVPLSTKTTQLTFSVLAGSKRKLFVGLCGKDYNNSSTCYKFIIEDGQPARVCTINFNEIDKCVKNIALNKIVNLTFVNQLTLKFENDKYTLLTNSVPLLEFLDTKIKPEQVLIGSDDVIAWKIQSYGLLTANTTGNTAINLNKGKKGQNICVAIFAQSCETCNLTIELQDKYNRSLDTKTPLKKNTWEELKLSTSLENDTVLKLRIMLNTTNNGRAFIGDIRSCTQTVETLGITPVDIYLPRTKGDNLKNEIVIYGQGVCRARIISTAWGTGPISCNSLKFPKVKPVESEMAVVIPTYNNDSIDIFWLSEYNGATKLQTELRYKGCGSSKELNISDHEKNIVAGSLSKTNLRRIPYTSYNISFTDGKNNLFSKNVDFEAADDFSHEEKNPTTSVTQMEDKLIVNVSVNDCKKIQGPLYYSIKANCSDDWCIGKSWENSSIAHPSAEIELLNIFGQSKYKISIAFSRTSNSTNLDYKEILLKNTDPIAPNTVRNLTLYAKTNNSISIRWKEPYPKNGILEKYIINYMSALTANSLIIDKSNLTNCRVWKDYICQEITGLDEDTSYTINVMAKNEDVDKFSEKSSVNAITYEEAPKEPENLQLTFDEYLNMTINCSYPHDAIGPVREIHVEINGNSFSYPITEESRNYSQQINATEFSAKNLTVGVKFANVAGFSNIREGIIESPPKTPKILDGFLQRKTGEIYLSTGLLQDLEGRSEIFVFQKKPGQTSSKFTKKCTDLETLKQEFSQIINTTVNKNQMYMQVETGNVDSTIEKSFIALLKNTHGKYERCALFSEFSISEDDNYSHTLIGTLITLLLLCLCAGILFYMYKKDIITCKLARPRGISEMDNSEMTTFSHLVHVEKLEKYVTESLQELVSQYKAIQHLSIKPYYAVGLLPQNQSKNRYKDIIAYDNTRVMLQSVYSNENDDYINASYINGFNKEKAYIATQAPTTTTLYDFWRMIWQENVECIVMLCKLKEKGEQKSVQYWPKMNQKKECNDFEIRCTDTTMQPNHNINIRKLILSRKSERRQITQIHYQGWPEKGVPGSLQALRKVLWLMEDLQKDEKRFLVHGCGGVGRTGTLILCDIAIKMAEATKSVDIFSILYHLRQQRMRMVETLEQYAYAHEVVMHLSAPIY